MIKVIWPEALAGAIEVLPEYGSGIELSERKSLNISVVDKNIVQIPTIILKSHQN